LHVVFPEEDPKKKKKRAGELKATCEPSDHPHWQLESRSKRNLGKPTWWGKQEESHVQPTEVRLRKREWAGGGGENPDHRQSREKKFDLQKTNQPGN